jgi:hypothetical protein
MFTQTLIHDLALHPHQFGLDVAGPNAPDKTSYRRSRRSRQPRAVGIPRSVLLAAIAALVALVALVPLAQAGPVLGDGVPASGHKRPHPALGTSHVGSCVLPTFNPWLYVATCQAGTRATANPVGATATTGAVSTTPSTAAGTSTQTSNSTGSGYCSQADLYPAVYLEQCQAAAAASDSSVGATSQSTGGTTGDATSQPATSQPSTGQPAAGGQANSCTTDPNNPWLALEGGC